MINDRHFKHWSEAIVRDWLLDIFKNYDKIDVLSRVAKPYFADLKNRLSWALAQAAVDASSSGDLKSRDSYKRYALTVTKGWATDVIDSDNDYEKTRVLVRMIKPHLRDLDARLVAGMEQVSKLVVDEDHRSNVQPRRIIARAV